MKIDLSPLLNNMIRVLEINETVILPLEFYKNTDIKALSEIKLIGSIDDIGDKIFNVKLNIRGTMTLPCSLSLEDVDYPFEINIDQNIGESEEIEENYKIIANTLDIFPILWENIVLEIPNRIVKPNVKINTEGDGWCLTDENIEIKNNQLSELLDMED